MSNVKTLIAAAALTLIGSAALAQSGLASTESYSVAQIGNVASASASAQTAPAVRAAVAHDTESYSVAQVGRVAKAKLAASVAAAAAGSVLPAAGPSPAGLTREQVRAEFLAARRSGELNPFDNDTYAAVSAHAPGQPGTLVAGLSPIAAR